MQRHLFFSMLILLCGSLSACGQSGNLYLPDKHAPTQQEGHAS